MPSAHASVPASPASLLGGRDIRRSLEAHLRRRVPSQEVDDIAQAVLAAAVAAPVVPTDPEDLRRWLTTIAQHKVADFHRRRARVNALIADGHAPEGIATSPAAFEERDVLRAVLGEERTTRDADAMDWLLREHSGERLADIASEKGVPAPVVRQRVSRLRRALRSKWSLLVALAVIVGAGAFAAYSGSESIAKDPELAMPAPMPAASAAPTDLATATAGEWIVRAVRSNRALSVAEQQLVDMEALNATLRTFGKRIELVSRSGSFKTSWRITRVEKTNGKTHLVLLNETGRVSTADVVFAEDESGARLDIELHDPRFGGNLTLRRPTK